MNIDHYVTVNFNAMIDIVDALGGIEVDLTEDELYWTNEYCGETSIVTDKSYEPLTAAGVQTLGGVQATAYCRILYTAGSDFKRTERQRLVIQKIAEKLQKANLATINKIVDEVFSEVGTNFTMQEILSYAKDFKKYKLGEMTGFPYSVGTATLSGVGSSVIPTDLTGDVTKLHQFFFGDDGYTPSDVVKNIDAGIKKKSTDVGKSGTSEDNTVEGTPSTTKSTSKKSSESSTTSSSGSSGSGSSSSSGSSSGSSSSGSSSGSGSSGSGSGGGSESGGSGSGGSSSGGGSESGGSSSGGGESSGGESAE